MRQQTGLDSMDRSAIAESRALKAQGFKHKPISNNGVDNLHFLWERVVHRMRELAVTQGCNIRSVKVDIDGNHLDY